MFDKMKALMEMNKKMQELKKQLEAATFEVESPDKLVKLLMSGSQEVRQVNITQDLAQLKRADLEQSLAKAFNLGVKKSQKVAAEKMQQATGFNLPT